MPNFSITETTKEKDYNPLSVSPITSFHQAYFYGEWQKKMGRGVKRFKIENGSEVVGFFQIITYPLIFKKNYCYIPHGPVLKGPPSETLLREFYKTIRGHLKKENAVFARFDFFPLLNEGIKLSGFKKTPVHSYHSSAFQSKFNWILNIQKNPEELLAATHEKTRYRIRYAQRRGVETEVVRGAAMQKHLETFYRLMQETAARGKFSLHPKKYYEIIFDDAVANPNLGLALARYKDEILATTIMISFGDMAFYPLGASSRQYKEYMATYYTHWTAILEAQKRGCKFYNFGTVNVGSATKRRQITGSAENQTENPQQEIGVHNKMWEGITEFKTRFRGELLEFSNSYDIVGQPFWYYLYNLKKRLKPTAHKKAINLTIEVKPR